MIQQPKELIFSGRSEIVSSEAIIEKFVNKRDYFTSRQSSKNPSNDFEDESEDDQSDHINNHNSVKLPGQSLINFLQQKSLNQNAKPLKTLQTIKQEGFNEVWKRGALRIIYLISKFLQMLKTSTDHYKFKLITPKIFSILGDNSADFRYYQVNGFLKDKPGPIKKQFIILFEFIRNNFCFKISLPIIKPDSTFKIYFDILVLILIIVNLLYIPLKLSFELQEIENSIAFFFLDTLPSIIFIIEVIMNFNTAYYSEGVIHEDRKEIFQHYLQKEFIWDLIVVIPFLISRFKIPFVDFVLLLRFNSVKRIIENIEEATSIREKFPGFVDLCKLISFLMFTNHICACVWHYLGIQQIQYSYSSDIWLIRYNMIHQSWISRYIYCFYWSTITTLTVGYGDIVPGNDIERFVSIVIILICSIIFGYTLTSIGSIFTQMKEKNNQFKNNMAQINSYIKQHRLNKQLQMKVRKYFEFYFKSKDESNEECQLLMDKLSVDLKKEVNRDIFRKILQRCKIITETFSEAFINELCEYMRLKHFLPGDIIFSQDKLLNQLLFLTKGEMQVFIEKQLNLKNKNKIQLRTYQKGYVIGTKNFFSNKVMNYSSKAIKFVEIAYLEYDDFINILKGYPDDYEKFAILRDNLIFNRNFNSVVDVCAICSSNHQLLKCPFGFFQVNRYKLISEKRQTIENTRQFIDKRKNKSKKFHKNRIEIQNSAIAYCFEQEIIQEEDISNDYEQKLGLIQLKSAQEVLKDDSFNEDDSLNSPNEKKIQAQLVSFRLSSKKDMSPDLSCGQRILKRQTRQTQLGKKTHVSFKQTDEIDSNSTYLKKISHFCSGVSLLGEEKKNDQPAFILDVILQDYKKFIKEDQIPELDRYFNFNFYAINYNPFNILAYLKEITDENCILILKSIQKKKFKNNNLKILMAKRSSKQARISYQLSFMA